MEPLALLVHPQQPLSYLERLIQSELPSIKNAKGEEKVPAVHFRAEDSQQDALEPSRKKTDDTPEDLYEDAEGEMDETKFQGRTEKTGKLGKKPTTDGAQLGEGGVESYSGLGHEGPSTTEDVPRKFVRWSSSTEVGDFIRDAARGKEFAVEIEGAPQEIKVGVPSFNDRTHYLRLRLRKTASKIIDLAAIKKECDINAHKGAQRVAMGGAAVLVGYWYVVYRLTFETDVRTYPPLCSAPSNLDTTDFDPAWLGYYGTCDGEYIIWRVASFILIQKQYLVGLSTLICGYLWFLYHNREVSYRSALNLTISRRQTKLYQQRGFDIQKWDTLIEEANGYRKEIKQIASEYDVDWDETQDEKDERVTEAMRKVRKDKDSDRKEKDDDDDEKED